MSRRKRGPQADQGCVREGRSLGPAHISQAQGLHTSSQPPCAASTSAEQLLSLTYNTSQAGTRNRTGQRYSSHYDIWEFNTLQRLQEETCDQFPSEPPLEGWVNINLYTPAGECFGILPIADALVAELALPPHESSALGDAGVAAASATVDVNRKSPYRHNFLARAQNTRYAVMHIHSPEERVLFGELSKNCLITAATD